MSFPSFYPPRGGWLRWLMRLMSAISAGASMYLAFNGLWPKAAYVVALAVWLRVIAEFDYYEGE